MLMFLILLNMLQTYDMVHSPTSAVLKSFEKQARHLQSQALSAFWSML